MQANLKKQTETMQYFYMQSTTVLCGLQNHTSALCGPANAVYFQAINRNGLIETNQSGRSI